MARSSTEAHVARTGLLWKTSAALTVLGFAATGCGRIQDLIVPPPPLSNGYLALKSAFARIDSLSAYTVDIRTSFPRDTTFVVSRSGDDVTIATGGGAAERAVEMDPPGARARVETRGL